MAPASELVDAELVESSDDEGDEECKIWFNNKLYDTWQHVKDAHVKISASTKAPGSVWHRVALFENEATGVCELRCKTCGTVCPLRNVSKWHKKHDQQACSKAASKIGKGALA